MMSRRLLASVIAVIGCLVALGPLPAAAGPTVFSSNLVCTDVDLGAGSLIQSAAFGRGSLKLAGPADADFTIEMKGEGLPPLSEVACAAICIVDGIIDFFQVEIYEPCGMTNAGGKFTFSETRPFVAGTFDGGCLLPVVGFITASAAADFTLCAPGFGSFDPVVFGP